MFIAELKPESTARPGYALLTIRNWEGDTESVSLSIQRNQDNGFLNEQGEWVGNAFQHQLSLEENGDDCHILLGKNFVDALIGHQQMSYRLTLKDQDGTQDIGALSIHSGVLSSLAEGQSEALKSSADLQTSHAAAPIIAPEPEAPVLPEAVIAESVIPHPEIEATISETPASRNKSKAGIITLIIILLLIIAGALAWFLLFKDKPTDTSVESAPMAATPSLNTAIPGACSVEKMHSGSAVDFVKTCLLSQPSGAEIITVINAAKDNQQCDIAQRLYAYKAQSGDNTIAMQYAREYDPETANKAGCFATDKETAMYWYETVANNDPQNKEARARLNALKK
ncbi:hypothetical protein [Moellerella wisconsensis]|uniref:Uncharacterized protein n=1 Tax=Moellerella wisconsensis TaxID=158849 RepID=A0ACD3Y7Q9_9GAMM|nr:hypothetical protein [Moellerella wisconsensis]UNH39187.1 hypothetical protein MNY70_01505 [Moellerella wisconsensis]